MFPARCAAVTLALLAFLPSLAAEQYPARPVTIVAPYAAGGGADLIARLIALKLGERLGQSFLVENRLGAGGVIAAQLGRQGRPRRLHAVHGRQHPARDPGHAAQEAAL